METQTDFKVTPIPGTGTTDAIPAVAEAVKAPAKTPRHKKRKYVRKQPTEDKKETPVTEPAAIPTPEQSERFTREHQKLAPNLPAISRVIVQFEEGTEMVITGDIEGTIRTQGRPATYGLDAPDRFDLRHGVIETTTRKIREHVQAANGQMIAIPR